MIYKFDFQNSIGMGYNPHQYIPSLKEDALAKPSYTVPCTGNQFSVPHGNCQKVAANCHYLHRIVFLSYLSKEVTPLGKNMWATPVVAGVKITVSGEGFPSKTSPGHSLSGGCRYPCVPYFLEREGAMDSYGFGFTPQRKRFGNPTWVVKYLRFTLMIFLLACHLDILDLPAAHDHPVPLRQPRWDWDLDPWKCHPTCWN